MPYHFYITTSWDDGHLLDMRLADLLEKYSLKGTFYVPLANAERPVMSAKQILELSRSFEIGAHTVNHCDLTRVPEVVAWEEIANCKSMLEQITGGVCQSFCFPKGHFRMFHLGQLKKAGYKLARTVELMSIETPTLENGVYRMGTTLQTIPTTATTYARNALKRGRPRNFFRYLLYGNSDWTHTAAKLLAQVAQKGGVFHLWGHSWEIAQHSQWRNLENVFARMAEYKTDANSVANIAVVEADAR